MTKGDVAITTMALLVGLLVCGWAIAHPRAEQKPYQAYPVYNGCLYITPQGFAVFQEGFVAAAQCK